MENESPLSSPEPGLTEHDYPPASDRRKSGRATRKPELFSQSYGEARPAGAKRKRDPTRDNDNDNDNDDDDDDEEEDAEDVDVENASESEDISDEEPDEEELKEKRRAARKASAKKAVSGTKNKKTKSPATHAAKRPKVAGNGVPSQLAFRPAANGKKTASRPRKPKARPSLAAGKSGLYAEVFGKNQTGDTVAAEWLTQYQKDAKVAMQAMVNFILRCTGTDLEVSDADIGDPDHAPERIIDLQNEYHSLGIVDYPLVSKARTFKAFQPILEDFFLALVQTLHHSSVLYKQQELYENLQIWLAALSTSGCRPFRHTSTVISLAIMNALCDVAREVMSTVSTSRKQLETEKKKRTVNQGRIDAITSAVEEGEHKLESIDEYLKDGVNIVFVHRYRDVDPKIRGECIAALGRWMRSYREYFFEGQFLRYFGWILSDPSPETRSVVVMQLQSLYSNKDNIAGLHSFTERFRHRMVEMAAHDADVGVRAASIELLDLIRDAGLIEPADIDTIGRLVFDAEPRVRKAAGSFFVANVQDVFDSTTEEVGEEMNEMFGDEDEDDFESPKRAWIKFKCLTDILQAYDEQENELKPEGHLSTARDALSGASLDTRFVLATEAIYPHFAELAQWQSLAGYLLYDHSQIPDDPVEDDSAGIVKKLYKMQEGQEMILLEVLCCAVKLRILDVAKSDIDKRGRKVRTLTDKIPEMQEEIAHSLAQIIPQLLNKYGSVPEAASAVLRLEHLVDLDKIQDLQKDATAYTSLLNDINKQFLTHSDQDVLAEASVAFVHAKSSDDMKEALESKVQELWDDIADALNTLSQKKEVAEGSSIPTSTLNELANTVTRISNLASVTDCTQVLETKPTGKSKGKKKDGLEAPFNILIRLIERGLREEEDDEESAKAETELVISSIRTLLFYFMWKAQAMTAALSTGKAAFSTAYFEALSKSREVFEASLVAIMRQRSGLDNMRFTATTTLLDLQTLFGTLRHAGLTAGNDEDVIQQTQSLVQEIHSDTQALIGKIHGIAERTYARKLRQPIEPAEDDEPASDSDLERDPSDDEDEEGPEGELIANERLRSTILAEQRLCELTGKIVLAIIGRIIDASGPDRGQLKDRLLRDRSRLGQNYREVLAFLDERKPKVVGPRPSRSKGKQAATGNVKDGQSDAAKRSKNSKSAERIDDEDDEEENDLDIEEDDEEDLRARGLVEDDHIDEDIEDEDGNPTAPNPDEDEVMGD
ncbi:cohesin subunit IRR1 [Aspergillus clavatus NRRL 1]|uniref:Nuclear cohesin complex subunit (Psc3), putative n=1 Tax=Aspergillus clavatus (strain ATCC 1007 / CBS 513.65 / DSM 816 / NCTC 3887 / NRRL 1 / QM 1276 / 107) TaxID=344612 RepID=A1C7U6_ASPCL|nr:nuclear cohesin complex subunit (Psc3), putative [Aspergillus clavatus NRRL 1]EAW14467.1 nuclear cohesin complex subunit (Psc3), putative [Aspergillus clavatus NRRL 1]